MNNTKRLGIFTLSMLIIGAIDAIRNLPATALFGSSLIFFFIFSAIVFLIPTALVSAELSSYLQDKGGIFHWVKLAFGDKMALFSVWLQWINTLIWLPTVLSFIVGTAAYLIAPELSHNKFYLFGAILFIIWFLTWINLKGVHFSARVSTWCALFGMILPMVLIILLAAIWIAIGKPLQIRFDYASLLPNLHHIDNWISLTAIMTSYLGVELAAVHIKNVNNPQKAFPKALFISIIVILITMIFGSLAIAIVMPKDKINLINGVMQAFTGFFALYHLAWITPLIALMIVIGTVGGTISWMISPAKGFLHAAELGFLPAFFTKENKHGVASHLLIIQAALTTLFCLPFLFMPSINGSYWLLTALSTQLYMLMYMIMFFAAICLKPKFLAKRSAFTIPGNKIGMYFTCVLGLIGCVITLFVGFIPPAGIDVGSILHYEMIFTGGLIGLLLPVPFFYIYQTKKC